MGGAFLCPMPVFTHCAPLFIMSANHLNTRWLRSQPTSGHYAIECIDAEAGVLFGVVMVEEGPAQGHGVSIEAEFINDIVAYDQRVFGQRGVKARFGHPSASSETMGTQLGVFKNIRKQKSDGKMQAIGDLHLLSASEDSPTHPGMRSWLLKMASEQPDFLMSSIVFQAERRYQRKPNGHKKYVTDEDEVSTELGDVFVEFGDTGVHLYTDLVEQGAATNSLFGKAINPHLFVAQADQFLAENPAIKTFIISHPEKVTAFFASIGIHLSQPQTKPHKIMAFDFKSWLLGNPEEDSPELAAARTALLTAKEEIASLSAAAAAADTALAAANTGNTALQSAVGQLETTLAAAQARIAELEALPAGEHTAGATDAAAAAAPKLYGQSEVELRFRKRGQ